MRQTIINLAFPVVNEIIEDVLATHPIEHHRQALAADESRDKLIAFVTSRMPACYMTVSESDAFSITAPMSCYSVEQHRQIRQLVNQGIQKLLNYPMLNVAGPASPPHMVVEPSTWFG